MYCWVKWSNNGNNNDDDDEEEDDDDDDDDDDDYNNNNNNYKTFIPPISSKIELIGAASTGVGQTQSRYNAKFINKWSDKVETKEG